MGVYCGQTVAVKVLRTDAMAVGDSAASTALQEEFVKEVSILRKVRDGVAQSAIENAMAGRSRSLFERGALFDPIAPRRLQLDPRRSCCTHPTWQPPTWQPTEQIPVGL